MHSPFSGNDEFAVNRYYVFANGCAIQTLQVPTGNTYEYNADIKGKHSRSIVNHNKLV